MEELEYLLAKYDFIKRAQVKNYFQDIESLINFKLPDDYKYYLNNYEKFEGFIGEQYIVIYGSDRVIEINKELIYRSNAITIGSNGASETVGIALLNNDDYRLIICQYIQDTEDQIEIGCSFTDMIERLHEGIEWFK